LKIHLNTRRQSAGLFTPDEYAGVERYFRSHPELRPTPLLRLPALASRAGLANLFVKDESQRFGAGAFKIAGVLYAVDALLDGRLGAGPRPRILACATEGNHGRAVARVARERGLRALVYMRESASPGRIAAIAQEGAEVILVDGTYDDAVHRLAAEAAGVPGTAIVSDTAWPGYEALPRAIMAGYTWLMAEAMTQWDEPPGIVVVQAGVGALAGAVASWVCGRADPRPYLICAEPTEAAVVLASIAAGEPTTITPGPTEMAGLRSGEVSSIAFPVLQAAVDACVAIADDDVWGAVRRLASPLEGDPPVAAGPSGACGAAALLWWMTSPEAAGSRQLAGVTRASRAFVLNTEAPPPRAPGAA
jgi:diaminopropionate ammonia-lyase